MKILYVYRGFGPNAVNSVIDAQAASLKKNGLDLSLYPLMEGGIKGYINAIKELKAFIRKNPFDILHGHYSFSAIVAALAFKGKTVVSLMGSDVFCVPTWMRWLTKYFVKNIWSATIVKSKGMKAHYPTSVIIPNGVDLEIFRPIEKATALEKTGFDSSKKHIIFVADGVHREEKNFTLAKAAVELLQRSDVQLHGVGGVAQQELAYYYNAADLLILTSTSEGSPNVIKEAMACNCPIVSTDVGDVKDLTAGTPGCFITTFEPQHVAGKIQAALDFGKRTTGREDIQHLDSNLIAQKIINLYRDVLAETGNTTDNNRLATGEK